MQVAVIGAGFSGVTTAKTLRQFGHNVTVFEQCPDIGGVWSRTRRYPGLATQNSKDTYYLSDMPMPKHYPTWPAGEQVQSYLEAYVNKHDLMPLIRLGTTVVAAEPRAKDAGWTVTVKPSLQLDSAAATTLEFDHLVVCNGVFCKGFVPAFAGQDEFKAAGGQVVHSSEMGGLDNVRGKNIVVVGYGKSACDVANAVEEAAASTLLIARRLLWKLPRKIYGLPYQYLLLTRFGESLFAYIRPGAVEKFLNGTTLGSWFRNGLLSSLQAVITQQLQLRKAGLLPPGRFEEIARSTISLSTNGFYEKVLESKITVLRDTSIERLSKDAAGKPIAILSDGEKVPCDMIVCATGFQQKAPFLPQHLQQQMTDKDGNWLLYQHVLPIGIPNLTFNGYNSSLFCPTSSEAAALWIAAILGGHVKLPPIEQQQARVEYELNWLDNRSKGKHAHGTNLVPFSLHTIDDLLDDIGVNISTWSRFKQWLLPVSPSAYATLGDQLRAKMMQVSKGV